MKKAPLLVLLVAAAASFDGCGGTSTDPEEPFDNLPPGDRAVASGTVDAGGGVISSGEFVLTVPSGALPGPTTISIVSEEAAEPPYEDAEGSEIYRIDGLPTVLGVSVKLRFRHTATAQDSIEFLIGEVLDGPSLGPQLVWRGGAFTDSSGWCLSSLAKGAVSFGTTAVSPASGAATGPIRVTVARGISSLLSDQGHFKLSYKTPLTPQARAELLAGWFEDAYAQIYSVGFHFGAQDTTFPLEVKIHRKRNETAYGAFYSRGGGHGLIWINRASINNDEDLQATAMHELFHYAQHFYDPRPPADWDIVNVARLWMDEAASTWVEEKLVTRPDYVPAPLVSRKLRALGGIFPGATENDADHGYGMAPFVRYVVGTQGESTLEAIYASFAQSGNIVNSLLHNLDPPLGDFLGDFHRSYLTGGIYSGAFASSVAGEIPQEFFAVGTYGTDLPRPFYISDLGSTVAKVNFRRDLMDENTACKIVVLERADCEVSMFGYNRGQVPHLLAYALDSMVVDNVKALDDAYQKLIFMITYTNGAAPECHEVNLVHAGLGLAENVDLSRFETAQIITRYHAYWEDGSETAWQYLNFAADFGGFAGSTYHAGWDSTETTTCVHYAGHITASLNPDSLGLITWSASNRWDYPSPDTYNVYEISGLAIRKTGGDDDGTRYDAYGQDVCTVVSHIYVKFVVDGAVTKELSSFGCDNDSYLNISFRDDD